MKAKEFRWLFLALLAALTIICFAGDLPTIGVSAGTVNGQYDFAGGTTPWAIGYALLVVALYVLLVSAGHSELGGPMPGLVRRFVAFWLDFMLAFSGITPLAGFLTTFTEWRRTGVFAWTVERTTPFPGDSLVADVGVSIFVLATLLYFALPIVRRVPSPAGCVLGYQIVCDEGRSLSVWMVLLRTALGFPAACFFYITPFIARDRAGGKMWLDKIFRTHAVLVK